MFDVQDDEQFDEPYENNKGQLMKLTTFYGFLDTNSRMIAELQHLQGFYEKGQHEFIN